MPDVEAVHEAWRVIIEELEADLARVASGSAPRDGRRIASADWSPPEVAGPLPEEYANYVRDLIERQREAMIRLEDARRAAADGLGALRAATSRSDDAVYLDVEG